MHRHLVRRKGRMSRWIAVVDLLECQRKNPANRMDPGRQAAGKGPLYMLAHNMGQRVEPPAE